MSRENSSDRSPIRRGLRWWFGPPVNPYVSTTGLIDFTEASAYLDRNRGDGPKITVNNLIVGAVARTLAEHPFANARLVAGRVVQPAHVGVAMPVNLLGHAGGERMELSMALLREAETLSLREIAAKTAGLVREERGGQPSNPVFRHLVQFVERAPDGVLEAGLSGLDRAMRLRPVAERFYAQIPVTTALTNPGAAVPGAGRVWFRGGAVQVPNRVAYVGTLWAAAQLQDEVLPVNGRPAVRAALPFMFVFDHRLFDGVRAGRVISRFADVLRDPAATFGPDGDQPPAGG